jgi:hypothetical protein
MRHILTLVIIDIVCGHPYMTLILLDYFGAATKEWYLAVTVFITFSVTANMCAIFIFNRKLRQLLRSKLKFWGIPQSNTSTTTSAMIPMRALTFNFMNGSTQTGIASSTAKYEIQTVE